MSMKRRKKRGGKETKRAGRPVSMKRGQPYEQVVEDVLRAMDPESKIERGKWIETPDGRRELDVLVTGTVDGVQRRVLVECKDYNPGRRLVGIRLIDELESNPTITCESGRIVVRTAPSVEKHRKYLVAVLQLSAQEGWRIYDCVLRITDGPLKGAIVTVCGPTRTPPSITDAYQAYYEVPDDIRVGEGALEFEVVAFWGK